MPTSTHSSSGKNLIYVSIYKNCDDALLFWRTKVDGKWDDAIPGCLGFSLQRQRKDKNGNWKDTEILRNRVGFVKQEIPKDQEEINFVTEPSTIWPFQRYDWTDHGANNGQTVRYQVVAVGSPASGKPGKKELPEIANSGWTDAIEISGETKDGRFAAYFNRGNVMSQYIARIMRNEKLTKKQLKEKTKELEEPIRRFLSGELRTCLLALLDEAINDVNLEFYTALYELSDVELIDRLIKLRGRAHVILANGSDKKADGNKDARRDLKKVKVDVINRMLGSKGLGHNKFAVIYNTQTGKAVKCWTGSTNWSSSGLCTQLNNGILINDSKIAEVFSKHWDDLAEAKDAFPKSLVSENDKSPIKVGGTDIWFTRMTNPKKKEKEIGIDLRGLVKVVESAKEMILYVMFQPGSQPLTAILQKMDQIYVKGVVSTLIANNVEAFKLQNIDVTSKEYTSALIQPDGVQEDFAGWLKEITRREFLFPNQAPGIGHAITHAKMIVIDPFTENCKVVTGSHNFSKAASENNDENFVVIHGDRELAEFYSVACLATYEHYRYRAYLKDKKEKGEEPWSHLSDDPKWQDSYLNMRLISQLKLWVR
jgi:hypothetical protein